MQFYEERPSAQWQEHIVGWARRQIMSIPVNQDFTLPAEGRMIVTMRFNMVKPKSYGPKVVHHTRKPDIDNLAKSVLDGLTKARVIKDDAYVTDLTLLKRYVDSDHPEGVEIDLTIISDTR